MTSRPGISRRHFLAVAGAAGIGFLGLGPGRAEPVTWRGIALGARAELRLFAADRARAEATIDRCLAEIGRLERLFSLYRPESAVARLNRDGTLDRPDPDLLALLSMCRNVHTATRGAFDPTVQPAWTRLAQLHAGLPVEDARPAGSFADVTFDAARVAFARPGMALTFNGIAQGYITDRIADLLLNDGFDHALVDAGEIRALGSRRDGNPWPVRVAGTGLSVGLDGRALATSATDGTTFDAAGSVGHIIDPASGWPAPVGRRVSVAAPTAVIADALSTAFCLMGGEARASALSRFAQTEIVG